MNAPRGPFGESWRAWVALGTGVLAVSAHSASCMGATLLANQFTAWTFDHYGTYVPAWQTYTALMTLAIVPVTWLWRRDASTLARGA